MAPYAGGGVSIVYESSGSEWCLSYAKNVQWLIVASAISRTEADEVNEPFIEAGFLLLPQDTTTSRAGKRLTALSSRMANSCSGQ
jgi:hypothetical protein